MERRLLVLLLLVSVCVLPAVPVHATVETNVFHFNVNPAHVPITIQITFAYTTNFTMPVVSTTNQSAWSSNIITNPPLTSGITFTTAAVDMFNFGFSVYYLVGRTQIVNIEVFQGEQQVEGGGQVPVYGDSFSMSFTVVTSVEPHVPTPEDIFNMWTGKYPTSAQFQDWTQLQGYAVADLENQIHMLWVLVFGGLSIFLAAYLIPKLRKPTEKTEGP